MEDLNWTGERLVTSVTNLHGTIEHLHRYALALELAKDKAVLDIASGEGYGTNILGKVAKKVIGVDISEQAIEHAKLKYKQANIEFKIGSTSSIPLADNSVDVVVSFETLEHHDEHEQMMREIKRVLTPKGVLIISSPEKSIYQARDPNNPYHIKELSLKEFELLLSRYFKNVRLFEQKFVFSSLINELNESKGFSFFDGSFSNIDNNIESDDFYNRPFFNLSVVSDFPLNDTIPSTSLFNGLKILHKEAFDYKNEINRLKVEVANLKASNSFRLGNLIVRPFHFLKKNK